MGGLRLTPMGGAVSARGLNGGVSTLDESVCPAWQAGKSPARDQFDAAEGRDRGDLGTCRFAKLLRFSRKRWTRNFNELQFA